jgi:hypothetical protein
MIYSRLQSLTGQARKNPQSEFRKPQSQRCSLVEWIYPSIETSRQVGVACFAGLQILYEREELL